MTVAELIQALQTMPPEAEVYTHDKGDPSVGIFDVEWPVQYVVQAGDLVVLELAT